MARRKRTTKRRVHRSKSGRSYVKKSGRWVKVSGYKRHSPKRGRRTTTRRRKTTRRHRR